MNSKARTVARFGLLTALSLVLGWVDQRIPLSALLGGAAPGIKLGLANTVLLYAVYLMDPRECALLMLSKVLLSGFLFGSVSAILYSLAGGALSLAAMLAVRKNPKAGALVIGILALGSDAFLLMRNPAPGGQLLFCMVLILLAGLSALAAFFAIQKRPRLGVLGTSLAGAVAHNVGQVLVAALVLKTPRLLTQYLPVLVGVGAAVGCLTGLVARRVFAAFRMGE